MIDASITPERAQTVLIPFQQRHVATTYDWVKNPELQRDFLLRGEITREGHLRHFEQLLADPTQTIYAITFEGTHVGNCGFKHIDPEKRRAELWIYLGSYGHQGKGIGNSATLALLAKGFNDLSLDLIYLHVAQFNQKAIALYQKSGFAIAPCDGCMEWADHSTTIIHMELPRSRWLELENTGV